MSHRYCGRDFSADEIAQIRRLIAEDPEIRKKSPGQMASRFVRINLNSMAIRSNFRMASVKIVAANSAPKAIGDIEDAFSIFD